MGFFIFFLGVMIGIFISFILETLKTSHGSLYIDKTDPSFATCGIKFTEDANSLSQKKYVVLKIER